MFAWKNLPCDCAAIKSRKTLSGTSEYWYVPPELKRICKMPFAYPTECKFDEKTECMFMSTFILPNGLLASPAMTFSLSGRKSIPLIDSNYSRLGETTSARPDFNIFSGTQIILPGLVQWFTICHNCSCPAPISTNRSNGIGWARLQAPSFFTDRILSQVGSYLS